MSKKIPELLFLAVCLLLALALSAGMLPFGPSPALANERQSPKPQLTADGTLNADFLPGVSNYISDHFFLRRELITGRSRLAAALGTSTAEDVVLGTDGWLYFTPTLDDYTGADPWSSAELAAAARNLSLMQEYCAAQGARFLFAAAPNKNSIYDANMPGRAAKAPLAAHDALRLYALLDAEGVNYVNLFDLIGAEGETLYFAHDSHWNSKGAALGADAINAAFGRESAYFSDPFADSAPRAGDLYEMLYPAAADPETAPVYGGALAYTRDGGTRPDAITINTAGGHGSGTLLAYRDSFGNLLYPYLADSFQTARFSRAVNYDLTRIGELGADCVLVELVERNLDYLLQNVPVMPAPARELAVTPERSEGRAALERADAASAVEGCVLLRGALPAEADPGAPVYLVCGGAAYEAFALENGGFAAYVPADAVPEGVLYHSVNDTPVFCGV